MFKKNCSQCNRKIDKKFRFCPWCGKSTRPIKKEDYGILGIDDNLNKQDVQVPFLGGGIGAMFSHLSKQLSKELQNLNLDDGNGGIEIRFSTGMQPQEVRKAIPKKVSFVEEPIDDEEKERRRKLPSISAKSRLRRLPEGIIYEIEAPGIRSKKEVSIVPLEEGLEVRAFSKSKCYVKTIPIKVNSFKMGIKDGKVIIQIKN